MNFSSPTRYWPDPSGSTFQAIQYAELFSDRHTRGVDRTDARDDIVERIQFVDKHP